MYSTLELNLRAILKHMDKQSWDLYVGRVDWKYTKLTKDGSAIELIKDSLLRNIMLFVDLKSAKNDIQLNEQDLGQLETP